MQSAVFTPDAMKTFLSRVLAMAIGLLVGVGLLALAFRGTDVGSVHTALADGDWTLPGLGVLMGTAIFVAAKTARWRCLLGGAAGTSTADLVRATTAGLALNALLPHTGEVVRAVSLHRRRGWVTSAVLASIVAERVFDLFAVLLLAAVALACVPVPAAVAGAVRTLGVVAAVGAVLIVAVLAWPAPFRQLARGLARPLPVRWVDPLLREVDAAINGLEPVRSGSTAARVLAWSLLQWLAIAGCVACSALVVGDAIGLGGSLLVVVGIVVAFLLPNAPGYAGSVQLAFVVSLAASGVPPAHAIAASVVYQLLMIFPVVVLGLAWLRGSLAPVTLDP